MIQTQVDQGSRIGLTTEERARMREFERENRELRRANEILKSAGESTVGDESYAELIGNEGGTMVRAGRSPVRLSVRKLGAIDRWRWVKSFGARVVTGGQW